MPQKKLRIVFPKGTKVGLPRGSWSLDEKGRIVALLTDKEAATAKALNQSLPENARIQGREAAIKLGGPFPP